MDVRPLLHRFRWPLLGIGLAAFILVPFAAFGSSIESWTQAFIGARRAGGWVAALVLGGLLAGDIVLPVPSSIVSTACGYLLGFTAGAATSLTGMTLACIGGYLMGASAGLGAKDRLFGARDLQALEQRAARYGDLVLVVSRPVPVLAEASVLLAGMAGVDWWRFLALTTLSNLGISVVYAAAGAWSARLDTWLLAFAAAVLLPYVAMRVAGQRATRRQGDV